MINRLFILLLIFLLTPASAQAVGLKKTMAEIMNSWIGTPVNTVINHWGYPNYEKTIAGKHLYYWDWEYTVSNPTYTNASAYTYGNRTNINGSTYGGGTRNVSCNRILEVDGSDKVVSWQWSGNNCPYTKVRLYKQWMNPTILNEIAYQKSLTKQRKHKKPSDKNAELNRTMEVTAKHLEDLKKNQK